ncbi:hypothetical protein ACFO0M_27665 [Micromonospora mangrovi]|uniref:Uncharacterized protein n=2 Tax=Micromonospora TaxID=1873 RepID=A0AAU7MDN9_9ACTN
MAPLVVVAPSAATAHPALTVLEQLRQRVQAATRGSRAAAGCWPPR